MATFKGLFKKLNGSIGDITFKNNRGMTVVSEKATDVKDARTSAQQKQRMKWANVIRMYKGISPLINYGFENKEQRVTDYNMFVKINMQHKPVYLTKSEVSGGACVIAPCQITQGTLPAIIVSGTGHRRMTDIVLGSLTIDETTTVAQFSNAVVQNNADYNYGDQISYFSALQKVNEMTGIPYGLFSASSVVLDKSNNTPLLEQVRNSEGYKNVDGMLGHDDDEGDCAFCWVHSRKSKGKTMVSTQSLIENNRLLALYSSQDAYDHAVSTYGGETDVFLSPEEVTGEPTSQQDNESTSDNGEPTSQQDNEPTSGSDDDEGFGGGF